MTQYTYEWWWILQTSQKLSHEDFDKIKLKISNCEYFMKNLGADINLPTVISLIFFNGPGNKATTAISPNLLRCFVIYSSGYSPKSCYFVKIYLWENLNLTDMQKTVTLVNW